MKHWAWREITVEEYGLGAEGREEDILGRLRTAASLRKLPSVRKMFILIDERWFRTYMTDALESVKDCFVEKVLDGGLIELLGVRTETYADFKDVDYGTVVVSNKY